MLSYTFQHTANLPAFRKALFPALPIFPTSDLDFQSFFIVPLFPYSCNVFSCKFKKKHHFSVLLQKAPSAAVISVRRKALMSRCLLKRFAYPIQMALRNQAVVVESKVLHAHAARRAHLAVIAEADRQQEILQAAQPDSVLFMVIRLSGTSVRLFKKRVF